MGGRGERMERRSRGGGLKRTLVDSKIRDGEGLQARMARGELRDNWWDGRGRVQGVRREENGTRNLGRGMWVPRETGR